jgi:hypothetical protein
MRLAALLLIPFATACSAQTPAIQMRFVDAEDQSPVADARVVYCAMAWEGTLTGHGGRESLLFRVEASTDAGGELRIPPQEFRRRPFGLSTNYNHARLLIAKPGYEPYKIDNWGAALGEYAAVSTWGYNRATIPLKRSAAGEKENARRRADLLSGLCGEGWSPPLKPPAAGAR